MTDLNFPLSNVQVELLKLYSTNLNNNDMQDLKNKLAEFYAAKAIRKADELWDKNKLTDTGIDNWLNEKS